MSYYYVTFFLFIDIVDTRLDELFLPEQALYEAWMRQDELLAYIDRQEEAKLRVKLILDLAYYLSPPLPPFSPDIFSQSSLTDILRHVMQKKSRW